MSLIQDILEFNGEFVRSRQYEAYRTDRFPNKKLVILSCMDTRLVELLPRAMNLRNGDVKVIKNAGAIVSHPFGSVMRSILVAVYELGATEVAVIGHHGCGMAQLQARQVLDKALARGVSPQTLETLETAGVDLHQFLSGFSTVEAAVQQSVRLVKAHPLLPRDVFVHGMVVDPETGALQWLINGYEADCGQEASLAQPTL